LATNNSPEFWKTVLDVMGEGVMLVKAGGAITYVNRAMEQLTGYSREELVEKTCAFLDFDCCPRHPGGGRQEPCPLFRDGQVVEIPPQIRQNWLCNVALCQEQHELPSEMCYHVLRTNMFMLTVLVSKWCPSKAKVGESRGNLISVGHKDFLSDIDWMSSLS